MNATNDSNCVRDAIFPCVGRACVAALPYSASGGSLHLHFEKLIIRPNLLSNPHLPLELRSHMGEYTILVQCEWRLQQFGKTIATSVGPTNEINRIVDHRLLSVLVAPTEPYDLSLLFDNDIAIDIFCNCDSTSSVDNYCVYAVDSHVAYNATEGVVTINSR